MQKVVSSSLGSGDMKELKGMVAPEAYFELQQAIANMSVAQRNEIVVKKDDIYLTFPYQVFFK